LKNAKVIKQEQPENHKTRGKEVKCNGKNENLWMSDRYWK
jgi:hypothetical protein